MTKQMTDGQWAVIGSDGQELYRFDSELLAVTMASAMNREPAPSVAPAGRWTDVPSVTSNGTMLDWCPDCNGDGYVSQNGPYRTDCPRCRGTGLIETDFPAADRQDAGHGLASACGDPTPTE